MNPSKQLEARGEDPWLDKGAPNSGAGAARQKG
jgi:hypothetical protein